MTDHYARLLSTLKALNPGTRYLVNRLFLPEKCRFMDEAVSVLRQVNEREPEIRELTAEQLREHSLNIRGRVLQGESLDAVMVEAFALVRESARRHLSMRHFDVQILGGVVLHHGRVAEMATGEGKTLVATLPLYLNALEGKGCHLVTVNDYLAKRDTQWMGAIFHALGLTVGCIVSFKETRGPYAGAAYVFDPLYLPADSRFLYLRPATRKEAYLCDITYGVGSEFGFDYLRDNMAIRAQDQVQRDLNFAIVDEVDSILIDEARTPLIISGPSEETADLYYQIDRLVRKLTRESDMLVDEEHQNVSLTDEGLRKCERLLGVQNLYDGAHTQMVHHIDQALRAHIFFKRDQQYVVRDGEVVIVDEFTGRLMPGRKWSDGLHQAIEAKEGVRIEGENQTLATVSYQNYFKLYRKLAGMTGTAMTEAVEFREIYKLDVIAIPTNQPLRRTEYDDEIYKGDREKNDAVVREVESAHGRGQPVLVGTVSIEKAEKLSRIFRHRNLAHQVLHGKNHEAEAAIIAQAGRPGAITIATQMAGRGVDILLGGNPEILAREETIKVIWSRKKESREPRQQKAFHEILHEMEDAYKTRMQELDRSFRERLDALKKTLHEKEQRFHAVDQRLREQVENSIFEKAGGDEFRKALPRLERLKERYLSAQASADALLQQFPSQPEKTKDSTELRNRTYREYEALKRDLRQRFLLDSREDVAEKRQQFTQHFERMPARLDEEKRGIQADLRAYYSSIENYEKTWRLVYEASVSDARPWAALSRQREHYRAFLAERETALESVRLPEAFREFSGPFLKEEQEHYDRYRETLDAMEKSVLTALGGSEYSDSEREYAETLRTCETEQAEYEKRLTTAREEYEASRGRFEQEWQRAREELEKSPEEFRSVFEELLEKYRAPWRVDHQKVVEAGGLYVIATERHEARRIDNQLRGRAGRQGDPGASKAFLSLEDDLLRIFGSERLLGIMSHMPEGENITHPMITRLIRNAQRKVEARNFEIRKQLLEFDNVLNEQRQVIYSLRQDVLEQRSTEDIFTRFLEETADGVVGEFLDEKLRPDAWNIEGLRNYCRSIPGWSLPVEPPDTPARMLPWRDEFRSQFSEHLRQVYLKKKKQVGPPFAEIQRVLLLQVIDNRWKAHLRSIDALREGIGLRAYAQKDPLIAYKQEGYEMFQEMLASIRDETLSYLFRLQVTAEPVRPEQPRSLDRATFIHRDMSALQPQTPAGPARPSETAPVPARSREPDSLPQPVQQPVRTGPKVERNAPCPCGSGKKYKKCCGKNV